VRVISPKELERRRAVARAVAPGRRIGAVTGSYISDLAALRQTILLCLSCDHKWNSRKAHYEPKDDWHELYGGVNGACDACREPGHYRKIYVHESFHGKV